MLTKFIRLLGGGRGSVASKGHRPTIIPRSEHTISRANISKHALKVLYQLKDAGYQAYLVGGGVRDVLLGKHPKDFDLATDARPEQVQKLFRNCRLIGRRFRLAHVHFGSHIVEVATFRASHTDEKAMVSPHLVHSEEGMILRDNVYGTLEEDVYRRDFTVNALYYNIADYSVVDFVGGMKDLQAKTLRMIGDAALRFREDPVRMLRAIRFAAKLEFSIHPDTEKPIFELAELVKQVPSARLLDDFLKLFLSGFAEKSFQLLRQYGIFRVLFPETESCLAGKQATQVLAFIMAALRDTDHRVEENKPVALPFILAAFLWHPVQQQAQQFMSEGVSELQAFFDACDVVLQRQQKHIAISRRYMQVIRKVWVLQIRLARRQGKRAVQVYAHPRFRAAYDFLWLRAKTGETGVDALAGWWKTYIESDDSERDTIVQALTKEKAEGRPYRRRRKKRV